jgi:hypothetical protein
MRVTPSSARVFVSVNSPDHRAASPYPRPSHLARPRSESTLCAMSIGQHRCSGSKVSLVNTDRWSLELEVCTRVLPGTTAKSLS